MVSNLCYTNDEQVQPAPSVMLTPTERALLRLMVKGCTQEEASESLGLTPSEAYTTLNHLQTRCGVSNFTRLIVLAILNAWV